MRFARSTPPNDHPRRGLARALMTVAGILIAMGPAPGSAAAVDDLTLRYAMHFGGFHVADLHFERTADEGDYEAGVRIRTTGIADVFVRYEGIVRAEGVVNGDQPALASTRYDYRYKSRSGRRTVRVTYDPATGDAVEVVSKKRGREDATEVPEELWAGVVDPVSAVLILRDHVRARRDGGPRKLELSIFDGRRRYDMLARIVGDRTERGTIQVDMTLRPIAGFDVDDMSDRERREGYRLRVQFSDDRRLLPLDIRTLNTSAIVVLRLENDIRPAAAPRD